MDKRVRRDVWDWVNILGDGLIAVLAGIAVVAAFIAGPTFNFMDDDAP